MKIYPSILRTIILLVTIAAVAAGLPAVTVADPTNGPAAVAPPGSGPLATPMAPGLPFGASEVVKMYQGGIGKDVIVNFVNNAALPFHLSADNIIYLQSLGVPQDITKAILVRDGQLQQQAAAYVQQMGPPPAGQTAAAPPPGPQGAQVVMPSTPPPDVGYPADYYDAGYPYYYGAYPYYYYGGYWPGWYGWGYRGGWGGYHGGYYGGFHGGVGGFGGFHGGGPAVRGGGGFGGHGGGGHGGGGGHR
jgi:hypothetical protein